MVWYNPFTWFKKKSKPKSKPTKPTPQKPTTPQKKPEQTIQLPGTYNPKTGIYISPSGQGYSTPTPPKGAGIAPSHAVPPEDFVKGTTPPSVRRGGGGGGTSVKAPSTGKKLGKITEQKKAVEKPKEEAVQKTLASQVKSAKKGLPQPRAVIELYKPMKGYGLQLPAMTALTWSLKNIGHDIKAAFTDKEYIGYSHWFEPFEYVGEVKAETIASTSAQYPFFGKPTIPRRETLGRGFRVPRKWEEVEVELEIQQIAKKGKYQYPTIPNVYERSGAIVPKIVTAGIETAATLNPLSATVMGAHKLQQGKEKEAALFYAVPAVGGVSKAFTLGRQITAGAIKEGMKAKGIVVAREIYRKGDEAFYITRAKRITPSFELTTKSQYPIFQKEGYFKIGAGTGKATIRYYDWNLGEWVSVTKPYQIAGGTATPTKIESLITKHLIVKPTQEGLKGWKGKVHIVSDEKIIRQDFGGITKGKIGIVGKVKKIRIRETGKVTALIKPQDLAITKTRGSIDLTGFGSKSWKSFRGGGKKSSPEYIQKLYEPELRREIAKGVGSVTLEHQKLIVKPITAKPQRLFSVSKAGQKISERVFQGVVPSSIAVSRIVSPSKFRRGLVPVISHAEGIKERMIHIPKIIEVEVPGEKGRGRFVEPIIPKPIPPPVVVPINPPIPPPPSPFTPPPLKLGEIGITKGVGRLKAFQIKGYSPSYFAVIFKIYGKKPKLQTGLGIRPITKNIFNFKIKPLKIKSII